MQTFLPFSDFKKSLKHLDYRRLGKQRVEASQLINVLTLIKKNDLYKENGRKRGWINHSATRMWKGYEEALKEYYNYCIDEWVSRGYNNNMKKFPVSKKIEYPSWLGNRKFHASHRSNLLRKNYEFYKQFNWKESSDLPYYWPA